jgi:DNA polymerase-3 subunit delta
MDQDQPSVYILHGEDEYALAQDLANMESRFGDPAIKEANTTRLDGRTFNQEDLLTAVGPMPFLAERRIVILEEYVKKLETPASKPGDRTKESSQKLKDDRRQFLSKLEKVPSTTGLVLVEHRLLPDEGDGRSRYTHWLLKWAQEFPERTYVKAFPLQGNKMVKWIMDRAAGVGGQFSPQAAAKLVELVGDDTRLADQEIAKLLDYVDFARPVQPADVVLLTVDSSQAKIFAMVDALGARNGQGAVAVLERLLEQVEHGYIFSMVVRQFRFLLLVREILDSGGGKNEISEQLRFLQRGNRLVPDWMAGKLINQAKRFTLNELEHVYQRLLDIDEDLKCGLTTVDLALEIFVSEITS